MRFTLLSFILVCFFFTTKTYAQTEFSAQQIIDKSIEATGGKEYLQSIKTLYTDMSTEMDGRKVNWITQEMLPNKGSFMIVYQGRTVFKNFYDGKKGYEISGAKKQLADQAEFSDKKFRKNIFNELDYLDPTLYTLSLDGSAKVENDDCYKVKATCINGTVRILYYSKKTFYQLREDKSTTEKGGFNTTYFSGYKKYGKLTYYSNLIFGERDKTQKATLVELVVNEKISDEDFH